MPREVVHAGIGGGVGLGLAKAAWESGAFAHEPWWGAIAISGGLVASSAIMGDLPDMSERALRAVGIHVAHRHVTHRIETGFPIAVLGAIGFALLDPNLFVLAFLALWLAWITHPLLDPLNNLPTQWTFFFTCPPIFRLEQKTKAEHEAEIQILIFGPGLLFPVTLPWLWLHVAPSMAWAVTLVPALQAGLRHPT